MLRCNKVVVSLDGMLITDAASKQHKLPMPYNITLCASVHRCAIVWHHGKHNQVGWNLTKHKIHCCSVTDWCTAKHPSLPSSRRYRVALQLWYNNMTDFCLYMLRHTHVPVCLQWKPLPKAIYVPMYLTPAGLSWSWHGLPLPFGTKLKPVNIVLYVSHKHNCHHSP